MWFLLSGALRPAAAQEAFSELRFALTAAADLPQSLLHEDWTTGAALGLDVETPFYAGRFGLLVHGWRARARPVDLTDFTAVALAAAWGPDVRAGAHFTYQVRLGAGSLYMRFDDEPYDFRRSESELMMLLRNAFEFRSSGPWRLSVGVDWVRAFTSIPLDFVQVGVSAAYTVRSPDWLRRALQ